MVSRFISLYDNIEELTAAQARELAAALLDAADSIEGLRDYDTKTPPAT